MGSDAVASDPIIVRSVGAESSTGQRWSAARSPKPSINCPHAGLDKGAALLLLDHVKVTRCDVGILRAPLPPYSSDASRSRRPRVCGGNPTAAFDLIRQLPSPTGVWWQLSPYMCSRQDLESEAGDSEPGTRHVHL